MRRRRAETAKFYKAESAYRVAEFSRAFRSPLFFFTVCGFYMHAGLFFARASAGVGAAARLTRCARRWGHWVFARTRCGAADTCICCCWRADVEFSTM